jgi:hypothetical protein
MSDLDKASADLVRALTDLKSTICGSPLNLEDCHRALLLIDYVNDQSKSSEYPLHFRRIADDDFRSGLSILANTLLSTNHKEGLLELWYFIFECKDSSLNLWSKSNQHIIERRYLVDDKVEAKIPDFRRKFLAGNFGLEIQTDRPILVCGMPKSASTSISNVLSMYFGRGIESGHNRNIQRHELDIDFMRPFLNRSFVIHTHLLPSVKTLVLLKSLRSVPIVTIRNIFDVIEARCRHESPTGHGDLIESPREKEKQKSLEYCISRYAFEYFHFAHQWLTVSRAYDVQILYFDEMIAKWEDTLRMCVTRLGANYQNNRGARVIEEYNRLTQASPNTLRISHIGQEDRLRYTTTQIQQLQSIANFFPDTDMSRLLRPPLA